MLADMGLYISLFNLGSFIAVKSPTDACQGKSLEMATILLFFNAIRA